MDASKSRQCRARSWFSLCACIFFCATLWVPIVEMSTLVVKPRRLQNLHKPKSPGLPSWDTFSSGKYQKKIAVWFLRRHGLWGHMVQLDNQLNLFFFDQISSKYKAALKVGADNWLFQSLYLDHFNRESIIAQHILEARALRLKRLQELLHERGIGFLLLLSANKIETYPEIVPPQYRAAKRDIRPSTYERFKPIAESLGLEILDAYQLFRKRAGDDRHRYFTASGSHWNDVGACEVSAEIAVRMRDFLDKPIRQIQCAPTYYKKRPNDTDMDLVQMANLWSRKQYEVATPYPRSKPIVPENEFRPRLLSVGTSFMWSLMRMLDKHKIHADANFWYYYRRARNYPSGRQYALKHQKINWEKDLLSVNYVIIETNIATLEGVGFSFLEDAIQRLEETAL